VRARLVVGGRRGATGSEANLNAWVELLPVSAHGVERRHPGSVSCGSYLGRRGGAHDAPCASTRRGGSGRRRPRGRAPSPAPAGAAWARPAGAPRCGRRPGPRRLRDVGRAALMFSTGGACARRRPGLGGGRAEGRKGRRAKAEGGGRRRRAEGRGQRAEGRGWRAEGRGRRAEGRRLTISSSSTSAFIVAVVRRADARGSKPEAAQVRLAPRRVG